MNFCDDGPLPKFDPFIGCDGKILSDELIRLQLESAIKDERYEWAQQCKIELERRKKLKKVRITILLSEVIK
jgi:hypothetical protein